MSSMWSLLLIIKLPSILKKNKVIFVEIIFSFNEFIPNLVIKLWVVPSKLFILVNLLRNNLSRFFAFFWFAESIVKKNAKREKI